MSEFSLTLVLRKEDPDKASDCAIGLAKVVLALRKNMGLVYGNPAEIRRVQCFDNRWILHAQLRELLSHADDDLKQAMIAFLERFQKK